MGIMLYSVLWIMQDLYHQPYLAPPPLPPGMISGERGLRKLGSQFLGSPSWSLSSQELPNLESALGLGFRVSNLGLKV